MIPSVRNLLISAALLIVQAASAGDTGAADDGYKSISVELNNGLLSLEASNAPLHEVIMEIGEAAGFITVLSDDFDRSSRVSVSYRNMHAGEAVDRLTGDRNRIIFYAPAGEDDEPRVISQIWLLASGATDGDIRGLESVPDPESAYASAQEQPVKDHKLITFTRMLQQDQAEQVRIRAARSLGELEDNRAILALESALLDPNASVRREAISALGRMQAERATMVLGNLLLNNGVNTQERVMAARALWQQDSDAARGYLQAGRFDTLAQIRMVSGHKPTVDGNSAINSH